jgi:hypothetical protein
MQIYFDEIDAETLDAFGGEAFTFNEKYYEYRLTVGAEDVVLEDSVGRMVPFAHFSIAKLACAINNITGISKTLSDAIELQDALDEGNVITIS